MVVTPPRLLLIAALVCFIIALLLAVGAFSGSDYVPWMLGGFVAWLAAYVVPQGAP